MTYKPSRFNFVTRMEDGLLIYNSLHGNLSLIDDQEDAKSAKKYLSPRFKIDKLEDTISNELFSEGFLVDDVTDEDEQLEGRIKLREESTTLFITVMPTEDCNFRCVYCFEHFKRGKMPEDIQDGVFNFVKKQLEKKIYTDLHINWFGGEPLYSMSALKRLGKKFIDLANSLEIRYSSSITTNGYLISEKVFDELIDLKVTHYTISLDGLAEVHDQQRILRNGGATFDKIIDNIKIMKRTNYDFEVQIRNNYSVESYEKLDDFLKFLNSEICDDIRFRNVDIRPIFDHGGYNEGNFDDCVATHLNNKFKGLEKAADYGLYNKSLHQYIKPGGIVCNASQPSYWLFGSDGKIMRCNVELDTEDRNIVGQIINENEYTLDFEKLSRWLDAGKDDAICKSCFFAPSCQGAFCAKLRFDNEKNGINKQPCPTEKKQLSHLLKVLYTDLIS